MSMQSFADLGVSRAVVDALAKRSIVEPFAVQRLVLGDVLAGRDVLAQSPTGSGKTLAFGIPLVDRIEADGPRPAALVLAPTRELAAQIVEEIHDVAHARALKVSAVYGGVGLVRQAKEAARSHIVVATPGRLEDQLKRGAFDLKAIRMLVLDEADRMLDMGFRPAVDRIVDACPESRQTLFFSATLDGEAGKVARHYTSNAARHEHGPSRSAAAEVEHRFVSVTHEGRVEALVGQLAEERELALVFVRTKRGADRLTKRLADHGVSAAAMHGNKSQRQRERALQHFEAGRIDTLVATDVAARGIDVAGISHVINYDPPGDRESYVHRVGRTGRAGRQGIGITLVAATERDEVGRLAGQLGIDHGLGGEKPARPAGAQSRSRSTGKPRRNRSRSDRDARGPGRDGSRSDRDARGPGRDGSRSDRDARGASRDGSRSDRDARGASRDGSRSDRDGSRPSRDGSRPDRDARGASRDGSRPSRDAGRPSRNGDAPGRRRSRSRTAARA